MVLLLEGYLCKMEMRNLRTVNFYFSKVFFKKIFFCKINFNFNPPPPPATFQNGFIFRIFWYVSSNFFKFIYFTQSK